MNFMRYPGGKYRLRNAISHRLDRLADWRTHYREPFFGGGGFGLWYLANRQVDEAWLNDANAAVASLWKVVANPELMQQLLQFVDSYDPRPEDFAIFRDDLLQVSQVPEDSRSLVAIAFQKLAIHQISYSGLGEVAGGPIGGAAQKSQYGVGCRWYKTTVMRKVAEASRILQRVKKLQITCMDFSSLLDCGEHVVCYLDPPYYERGPRLYKTFMGYDCHERLLACVKATGSKWLLSYDDHPAIRASYSWATVEEVPIRYSVKTSGKSVIPEQMELLIHVMDDSGNQSRSQCAD